jgi:hypothetical protein
MTCYGAGGPHTAAMNSDRRAIIVHRLLALVLVLLPIAIAACNQKGGSGY